MERIRIQLVSCPICRRFLKQITLGHIKSHNLTLEEFKKDFPNSVLVSIGSHTKRSNSLKRVYGSLEMRDMCSKRNKESNNRPEVKKKLSELSKRNWQNPKYVAKWLESMKKVHFNEAIQKKKSLLMKALHADLEYKEKHRLATKLGCGTLEVRRRRSISAKINCARPETKIKRSSISKLRWQNKELNERRKTALKITMAKPEMKEKHRLAVLKALAKPEVKKKHSDTLKKLWLNPEYAKKMFDRFGIKPTKPEIELQNILNELFPGEYKYVGNGEVFINGKNPDFINCNGKKKIIEMFGNYWHKGQDPQSRINIFKPYGYETLVIWENDLKNYKELVKRKIIKFHYERVFAGKI